MTNRAAAFHRRFDDAHAEALARDDGELADRQGALLPPRMRRTDMQTLNRTPQPSVTLAEVWERVSSKGSRYFSGFLGDCQLLMFDGGEKPHPTKPGETVHTWRLVLKPKDPDRRPAKPAAKPQERGDGYRGPRLPPTAKRAPAGSRGRRRGLCR